jgi:hypothetical protein
MRSITIGQLYCTVEGVSDSGEAPPPTQCECQQRRASWYVFDNSFVVPEYIVDFEYLTNVSKQ